MSTGRCVFTTLVVLAALFGAALAVSGQLGSLDAVSIGGGFR